MAAARAADRSEDRFAELDDDGDGVVVRGDLTGRRDVDIFERFDHNGDGVITEDELCFGPRRGFGPRGGWLQGGPFWDN